MSSDERAFWEAIRIEPEKWKQSPWGDEGGGFWVVAIFGRRVLWYNDIEHGFNISRYSSCGTIDEYTCDQQDLRDAVYDVMYAMKTDEYPGRFGPPEPLPD